MKTFLVMVPYRGLACEIKVSAQSFDEAWLFVEGLREAKIGMLEISPPSDGEHALIVPAGSDVREVKERGASAVIKEMAELGA